MVIIFLCTSPCTALLHKVLQNFLKTSWIIQDFSLYLPDIQSIITYVGPLFQDTTKLTLKHLLPCQVCHSHMTWCQDNPAISHGLILLHKISPLHVVPWLAWTLYQVLGIQLKAVFMLTPDPDLFGSAVTLQHQGAGVGCVLSSKINYDSSVEVAPLSQRGPNKSQRSSRSQDLSHTLTVSTPDWKNASILLFTPNKSQHTCIHSHLTAISYTSKPNQSKKPSHHTHTF